MRKIRKLFNLKATLLFIAVIFFLNSAVLAIDSSLERHLRKPFDFGSPVEADKRWDDSLKKLSGTELNPKVLQIIDKPIYSLGAIKDATPLPVLFYEKKDLGLSRGFIATNEFDWFKQEIDKKEADIFVGLGNNSVWDLAVRRNAKVMIIGDHDEEVIIAQEYLYKPLLLIAKSPIEFISMLAAVPIPEELGNASLEEVFDFIDKYLESYPKEGKKPTADRANYIEEIVARLKSHPLLRESHISFINKHLNWISRPKRDVESEYDGAFAGILAYYGKDNPYTYFRDRYNPKKLVKDGAVPEMVADPYFSSFSSMEAFLRLRNLFEQGNVYYFVADIADRRPYKIINELARQSGRKISGLSMCNIIDYLTKDANKNTSIMVQILEMVLAELEIDSSFTAYHTRGTEPPHSYEVYNVSLPQDIISELQKYGHDVSHIDRRTDLEFTIDIMNTEECEVKENNEYNVRLYFGDDIHLFFSDEAENSLYITNLGLTEFRGLAPTDELVIPTKAERMLLEGLGQMVLLSLRNDYAGIDEYLTKLKITHSKVENNILSALREMPINYPGLGTFLQKHGISITSLDEKIKKHDQLGENI